MNQSEFPVYRLTVLLFGVRQFIAGSQVSELPLGMRPAELVFVGFEQVPVTSVIVTDADLSIITSPITSTSPSITTTVTTAIVTTATSLTIPVARRFAFQFFRHSFPPAPPEPEDYLVAFGSGLDPYVVSFPVLLYIPSAFVIVASGFRKQFPVDVLIGGSEKIRLFGEDVGDFSAADLDAVCLLHVQDNLIVTEAEEDVQVNDHRADVVAYSHYLVELVLIKGEGMFTRFAVFAVPAFVDTFHHLPTLLQKGVEFFQVFPIMSVFSSGGQLSAAVGTVRQFEGNLVGYFIVGRTGTAIAIGCPPLWFLLVFLRLLDRFFFGNLLTGTECYFFLLPRYPTSVL
jgi:hypothetical protein